MSDFAGGIDIRTSHYWAGHAGAQPRFIIVHGTAGGSSAQEVAQWFQSNSPATSTHYVVGRDGAVVQCVAEADSAWGNGILTAGHDPWWDAVSPQGNPNWISFSIEHVKPSTDNSDQLTPEQQAASFALIEHLCAAHGIARRPADASGGITGHFSIDPVNRAFCPGPYPWAELYAFLNGGQSAMGWMRQPDGSGKDDQEHTCGAGFMSDLETTGMAARDGLMNETYINQPGVSSFLPLSNGETLVWDSATQTVSHDGALVALRLYEMLQAAEAKVSPIPPEYVAAKTAVDALKAAGL